MRLSEVDLANLDSFTDAAAPWQMFEVLRREDPVHWNAEPSPNKGFWAVTRHADIVDVTRAEQTFSAAKFVNLEELDDDQMELRRSMLETDGPRHRALRRLLQRDLSHRAVAGFEPFLRGLTALTLDAALAKQTFDFVAEVAADFPINVLARLLGVPEGDTHKLIHWGNRILGNTDPEYADVLFDSADSERYRDLPFRSPAALEVFEYGRELARQRRGGTGEDLVSKLVNGSPEDGVPLSTRDFDSYFLLLVVAGNETTRHAISHSMLALLQNPDQLAKLRDSPELMPTAVDEFLRWSSPVYHFRRTATHDVDLHGRQVRAGDKVVVWYASGNRDGTVFADPDRFDITRQPNDHMAFGKGGPHFCLGAALARLEMRVMFEELLPRLADIRLAGEVTRMRSNFVNGIKTFPVSVALA